MRALRSILRGAARDDLVVAARAAPRLPVVRSGTPLEVAELAWIAEGVSRETALSLPPVAACRNLIVGTVVQIGLYRFRGGERLEPGWLLSKPDPSLTMPATIGGTVDDLVFRGRAYWRVLERDAEGTPTRARWTPVADIQPRTESTGGSYATVTGYEVAGAGVLDPADLIRFDSPLPGVLDIGGRTIRSALELEDAARRMSAVTIPAGTLTNESGELLSPDEAAEVLQNFEAQRRLYGLAFLQGYKYQRENVNAADLQHVEARSAGATDVARLFNVPVAMIGASPSGGASALLYSNLSQQLAILISSAVGPYLRTIEATLSDVLPRGQSVAFDVQTFLRSDPQAAADYAIALLGAGIITAAEARSMLGIPAAPTADLTPGRV